RRRHTRFSRDWSSDVCSSDLVEAAAGCVLPLHLGGQALPRPSAVGHGRVPIYINYRMVRLGDERRCLLPMFQVPTIVNLTRNVVRLPFGIGIGKNLELRVGHWVLVDVEAFHADPVFWDFILK